MPCAVELHPGATPCRSRGPNAVGCCVGKPGAGVFTLVFSSPSPHRAAGLGVLNLDDVSSGATDELTAERPRRPPTALDHYDVVQGHRVTHGLPMRLAYKIAPAVIANGESRKAGYGSPRRVSTLPARLHA